MERAMLAALLLSLSALAGQVPHEAPASLCGNRILSETSGYLQGCE
jgi:hypothetical protein